jgi:thymidine kinase
MDLKNIEYNYQIMEKYGRLELIIGPMYASKTTELIKISNRYKSIQKNILAINHKINNRYGTCNIMSHDSKELDNCKILTKLCQLKEDDLIDEYNKADIIIIEELQFFEDAYEFITNATDIDHKIIIAAGLDGDSNREPFGDVLRLIPYAEKVTKLSAFCKICQDGTLGYYTKRLVDNTDKVLVGTTNEFIAVCRRHYLE